MSGDTPPAVLRPSADKSDKLQGLERPQKNSLDRLRLEPWLFQAVTAKVTLHMGPDR